MPLSSYFSPPTIANNPATPMGTALDIINRRKMAMSRGGYPQPMAGGGAVSKVHPYLVNDGKGKNAGHEAFKADGEAPKVIPGGEKVMAFHKPGTIIPARRTASLMKKMPMAPMESRKDGGRVVATIHPHGQAPVEHHPMAPARPGGLERLFEDQNDLAGERAARESIDPVSGLPRAPSSRAIEAQLGMLAQKPQEFAGFGGSQEHDLMRRYYAAQRSRDPALLAMAAKNVNDYKNRLNALRGQGSATPQPGMAAGNISSAMPQSTPPAAGFAGDSLTNPSAATAGHSSGGVQIPTPQDKAALGGAAGAITKAADQPFSTNLGTGSVYNTGGGTRKLFSQYGTGSSFTPPPAAPPAPAPIAPAVDEPSPVPSLEEGLPSEAPILADMPPMSGAKAPVTNPPPTAANALGFQPAISGPTAVSMNPNAPPPLDSADVERAKYAEILKKRSAAMRPVMNTAKPRYNGPPEG